MVRIYLLDFLAKTMSNYTQRYLFGAWSCLIKKTNNLKVHQGPFMKVRIHVEYCTVTTRSMCTFIERFLKHMWKSNGRCCLATKSCPTDSFATPWTVACQDPLSMGFPRQEYWSGLPFPSPWDLPNPDTAGRFFPLSHQRSPKVVIENIQTYLYPFLKRHIS